MQPLCSCCTPYFVAVGMQLSHVAALCRLLLQDAKAALDWLAAFHALWWEEVRTMAVLHLTFRTSDCILVTR